jgi:hypothetical protein
MLKPLPPDPAGERRWWQERKLDPLAVAEKLWRLSHPLKPSGPVTTPSASSMHSEPARDSEVNTESTS